MSAMIEQIDQLPTIWDYSKSAIKEGREDDLRRWALVQITHEALHHLGGSLGMFLEHPDMPSDARPVAALPVVDATISVIFESREWDKVPEGAHPPHLVLYWKREEEGDVVPDKRGAKPTYDEPITCPHCHHTWK